MNGKKKSSEINHKPEHLPKRVVNIFWSYLSETKENIKRRPLLLFDSVHGLCMRYFSYHMFLLTFRNQFIAFCIWYLCHVTKVVNLRKVFPSYSYLEPNCRWLKISPNVSIREKWKRKPLRFFSTCTDYEILWKFFSFSKFKISLPEACRCFAKEENDWTFQSVQSEFHRMLVSSKNISQSRNVATMHFTSPRIFTIYWIFWGKKRVQNGSHFYGGLSARGLWEYLEVSGRCFLVESLIVLDSLRKLFWLLESSWEFCRLLFLDKSWIFFVSSWKFIGYGFWGKYIALDFEKKRWNNKSSALKELLLDIVLLSNLFVCLANW